MSICDGSFIYHFLFPFQPSASVDSKTKIFQMKFLFLFLPLLHFIIQAAPQDNVSAIDELYAELFSPQNKQVVKERGHAKRLVNALVLEEMIEKEISQIHDFSMRMETNAAKNVEKVDSRMSENYKKLKAEFHGKLKNEVDIMDSDVCKIWEFLVEFRQIKTAMLEGNAETIEQTETSTGKCMELDDHEKMAEKQGGKATKKKKVEAPSWLAHHEWDILFAHFEHLKGTLLLLRRDGRGEQPSISCKFIIRLEQFMVDANTGQRVNLGHIFNDALSEHDDAMLFKLYKQMLSHKYGMEETVKAEVQLSIPLIYGLIMEAANISGDHILIGQLQMLVNIARLILTHYVESELANETEGKEIAIELFEFWKFEAKAAKQKWDEGTSMEKADNSADEFLEMRKAVLSEHSVALLQLYEANKDFRHFLLQTQAAQGRLVDFFGGFASLKKAHPQLTKLVHFGEGQINSWLKQHYLILLTADERQKDLWVRSHRAVDILAFVLAVEQHSVDKKATMPPEWSDSKLCFMLFVDSMIDKSDYRAVWLESLELQNSLWTLWKRCGTGEEEKYDDETLTTIKEAMRGKYGFEDWEEQVSELKKMHRNLLVKFLKENGSLHSIFSRGLTKKGANYLAELVGPEHLEEFLGKKTQLFEMFECPDPGKHDLFRAEEAEKAEKIKDGAFEMVTRYEKFLMKQTTKVDNENITIIEVKSGGKSTPAEVELFLNAMKFHYKTFLKAFSTENNQIVEDKEASLKVYQHFLGRSAAEMGRNEHGWSAEFEQEFTVFLRDNQKMSKKLAENKWPDWSEFCQLEKFVERWTKDEMLLRNGTWRRELENRFGLPPFNEPNIVGQLDCANEAHAKMLIDSLFEVKNAERMQKVHQSNLEKLIELSPYFRGFLCVTMPDAKSGLLLLLNPSGLAHLEETFPEILQISKMEPNMRWYFYEQILALDPPRKEEVPEEEDDKEADRLKSEVERGRRRLAMFRMASAMLLTKFGQEEEKLLKCQPEGKGDLEKAFKRMKLQIYCRIRLRPIPAVCLLTTFIKYFQARGYLCEQAKSGDSERVAEKMDAELDKATHTCEQGKMGNDEISMLADDHFEYLKRKLQEKGNAGLVRKFKEDFLVQIKLYYLLDASDTRFANFPKGTTLKLIDHEIFRDDQKLIEHYLKSIDGRSARERLANKYGANQFIWYRWMHEQIHMKRGIKANEWQVERNQQWMVTVWKASIDRFFMQRRYVKLWTENLEELEANAIKYLGWLEGTKHFVEEVQRESQAEFEIYTSLSHKAQEKRKRKEKLIETLKAQGREVNQEKEKPLMRGEIWETINEEGTRENVTPQDLTSFDDWLQQQHLREIKRLLWKYEHFREKLAQKLEERDETAFKLKLGHFLPNANLNFNEIIIELQEHRAKGKAEEELVKWRQQNEMDEISEEEEMEKGKNDKKKGKKKKKSKKTGRREYQNVDDGGTSSSASDNRGDMEPIEEGRRQEGRPMEVQMPQPGSIDRTAHLTGQLVAEHNAELTKLVKDEVIEKTQAKSGKETGGTLSPMGSSSGSSPVAAHSDFEALNLKDATIGVDGEKKENKLSPSTEGTSSPKDTGKKAIKRGKEVGQFEVMESDLGWLPEWEAEQFLDDVFLADAYKIFLKGPERPKRHLLDIGVLINEIGHRMESAKELRSYTVSFEAMFPKERNKSDFEKIDEEWKKWNLLEKKVENKEDLADLERKAYKLLKEIYYTIERMGEKRAKAESKEETISEVKRQLHARKLTNIIEESEWEAKGEGGRVSIVKPLFGLEKWRDVKLWTTQITENLADLNEFKEQRRIDSNKLQIFAPPTYLNPELFQQITFEGTDAFSSSNKFMMSLFAGQFREEKKVKKARETLVTALDEWAEAHKLEYKLLYSGSHMLGIDTVDSDLDAIILVPEILVVNEHQKAEGKNAADSPKQPAAPPTRSHQQFFGAENFFCAQPHEINCPDQSFYCRLCRDAQFTRVQKVGTRVPLVECSIDGVDVDVAFVAAPVEKLPDEKQNPNWINELIGIMTKDQHNVHSLASHNANQFLVSKFPTATTNFRTVLVALKIWAKKNFVYSSQFGFLNGISLAVMVAKVCLLYPGATVPILLERFFLTYLTWSWPSPVRIKDFENEQGAHRWSADEEYGSLYNQLSPVKYREVNTTVDGKVEVKEFMRSVSQRQHRTSYASLVMPVLTPTYPEQQTAFNVNRSTKHIILEAMADGLKSLGNVQIALKEHAIIAAWETWLDGGRFMKKYRHFLVLTCAAQTQFGMSHFCGFVENRLRLQLIFSIEAHPRVTFCHIGNSRKQMDCESQQHPNMAVGMPPSIINSPTPCKQLWLIGLRVSQRLTPLERDSLEAKIDEFVEQIKRAYNPPEMLHKQQTGQDAAVELVASLADEKELRGKW